jgi:MFS family permease
MYSVCFRIGRRAVLFIGVFIIVLGRCASAFTAGYYSLFVVANGLASLGISAVLGAPYIIGIVAEISGSIFFCGKLGNVAGLLFKFLAGGICKYSIK